MNKLLALSLLSALAPVAYAESYQTFGSLSYWDTSQDDGDDSIGIGVKHYFAGQKTLGPLDQFSYLEDTSSVRASGNDNDTYAIGGSYYAERFGVGADYVDSDGSSATRIHGDFFFTNKFKTVLSASYSSGNGTTYRAGLEYDHNINDSDYIGFSGGYSNGKYSTIANASTKYLNALDNGGYLSLSGGLNSIRYDLGNNLKGYNFGGKYYFNQYSGVGLNYSATDSDEYEGSRASIDAIHFFNENFSMRASYSDHSDEYSYENLPTANNKESYGSYQISANLQF